MKRGFRAPLAAALALVAAAAFAPARPGEHDHSGGANVPNPAWDSLKTLVGDWDGVYEGKVPTKASYRLVSNGTALMETLAAPGESEMITMYHPDGGRIAVTHYCSDNNQPRMRADSKDPKRIAFRYVDATNLAAPDAPHMTGLVVTLKDADHFTQEWTHTAAGQSQTALFSYTRRK
jgi:hypothetical protein